MRGDIIVRFDQSLPAKIARKILLALKYNLYPVVTVAFYLVCKSFHVQTNPSDAPFLSMLACTGSSCCKPKSGLEPKME